MLRVRLLGGLSLECDGRPVPAPGGRCGALLAWLALHPGLHARGRVAAQMWPNVLDESARASLRTALLDLRRALGPQAAEHLHTSRDEVGLGPEEGLWVDTRAFAEAVAAGRLADALALARGELLPEFEQDWVYTARDEHRHAVEQVLEGLGAEAEAAGDHAAAVAHTRRLTALDPLSEEHARALVRRLAAGGDRAAALAVYDRHREQLRSELGLAPSAATRALVEDLRSTEPPPPQPVRPELPGRLERHAAGPLHGRSAELEQLAAAWQSVAGAGELHWVVLAGEPGIGKTRLLAELCARTHADGATVLYGRCQADAPFPFGPLAEALRRYADAASPARIEADAGAGAGQLARLVPQLARHPPGEGEEVQLYDAIAAVVAGAARPAAVLALEDLQWTDRPTLRALERLSHANEDARVLVVATYRDTEVDEDHPFHATLARLRRAGQLTHLRLEGLDADAVAAIARERSPDTADRLLGELRARTGGNPYFVEEFLRELAATGAEAIDAMGVPKSVQDLIARRVERVGGAARAVVAAAAVIGVEFDTAVLGAATDAPPQALVNALEEGLRTGALVESEQSAGSFAFAHALVRETLYQRLSAARRAHLHGRVAQAIEQCHANEPELLPALARHHEQAGDAARALHFHALAADAAASVHAADEALHHLSRALDAAGELGLGEDDARVYGARHRRAMLRQRAGDVPGAIEDTEAAVAGARAAGDPVAEIEALNRRAFVRRFQRVDEGAAIHEDALRAAEAVGDPRAQSATLARLAIIRSSQLHFDEAAALAQRAVDVAERAGDDQALKLGLDAVKHVALELGDLATLEQATSRLLELKRGSGVEWDLHWLDDWVLLERAFLAIATAQWDAALAQVQEAVEANRRQRDRFAEPIFLDALTWIHRSRGDHVAAIAQGTEAVELALALENPEWTAWTSATLGWALLEAGEPARAAALLEPGIAAAEQVGARGQLLRCTALLAWTASDLHDRERALTLAAQAEELLATMTAPAGQTFLLGAHAPLAVARVRLAGGEPERALALVTPVLDAARQADWRETVAYATLLAGRAGSDGALVEEARALARRDRLPWIERQASLGAPAGPAV